MKTGLKATPLVILPGCVLVMPDEGDLLEVDRQTEIVVGDFPAPAIASMPTCRLAACPIPSFVTKRDPELNNSLLLLIYKLRAITARKFG